jgi:dTDP-4-amino-4,6-dideoxygalactose transaminase
MSELHATIALASLEGLDERVAWRNHLVGEFRRATSGVPGLRFQRVRDGDVSTYKDLTLVVDADSFGLTTTSLAQALRAEGIDSRHYYSPPVHRQKAYANTSESRDLPITDLLAASVLTVPLWSHSSEAEVRTVADAVVRIQDRAADVVRALATAQA